MSALENIAQTWLNHLAVERGVSANTLSNYRRDVRRYLAWLGDNGVEDLRSVTRPMSVTGADTLFDTHADLDSALAAVAAGGVAPPPAGGGR